MGKVWSALDKEFAREEEVIIDVNVELKSLISAESSIPEHIVELRNLPVLEEAMKAVDRLDHLCSPDRANLLLTKFDERTLHEWDYFRTKNTGSAYQRFFNFLLDRYDATNAAVARTKSTFIAPQAATPPQSQSGSANHTQASDKTNCKSKSLTSKDVVYSCPGCGRGTAVGDRVHHCLEHCAAYMQMSANDRSACIEKAKWCPVISHGIHFQNAIRPMILDMYVALITAVNITTSLYMVALHLFLPRSTPLQHFNKSNPNHQQTQIVYCLPFRQYLRRMGSLTPFLMMRQTAV